MDGLLQVKSIVCNVATFLNTRDYLSFRSVNKKVHDDFLDQEFELNYYAQKLELMGLEVVNSPENENEDRIFNEFEFKTLTAVDVFTELTVFEKKDARDIFKYLYSLFNDYCVKLYNDKLSNFFPPEYESDPSVQSKILLNIEKFNKSNIIDFEYFTNIVKHLNILKEVFTTSCLNEMELNYSEKNYERVGKFINILLMSNEKNVAIDFFNSKVDYPVMNTKNINISELSEGAIDSLFKPLQKFVIEFIEIIDTLFKQEYCIVMDFYESFIQQSLLEGLNSLLELDSDDLEDNDEAFLELLPVVYFRCIDMFATQLPESQNGNMNLESDMTFHNKVTDLLNIYLIPKVENYLRLSTVQFEKTLKKQFKNFEIEQENQRETDLINMTTEINDIDRLTEDDGDSNKENKMNFLDSFTKVFRINNKQSTNEDQLNSNLSNLMNRNLQNIKSLVNLELCYNVVQQAHDRIDIFQKFKCITKLRDLINERCEEIFKILINTMNEDHVKPAFEKAMSFLEDYDPVNSESLVVEDSKKSLEPLTNFAELINIGDIILQMISIFYKNEMINRNIIDPTDSNKKNIWQNQLLQNKKNFETTLDNFVADGLNIGINKLIDEINLAFNTTQLPTDYYPPPNDPPKDINPSKCARKVVEILNNHCFILTGATDKGTIDVYQQEIGRRFFLVLVEHVKKQIISTLGAVQLICDINYYYTFINEKLRQKSVVPYFKGLKNVSSLYLIDTHDSKELGKLIGDLGKFQGIFTQEEIYEFVQRRQDWIAVKRDVEKVMYGLGIKDCTIM